MMEQVKIKQIKIIQQRADVRLSNGMQMFFSTDIVTEYKLVEGIILTQSQLEILSAEAELYQCQVKAKNCLAMREHSSGELYQKLKKKRFSKEVIDKVVRLLERHGFINNERYALNLAERLIERKPCGRSYLMAHLQQKMIPREIVEKTAHLIFDSADLDCLAEKALEKKWYMYQDLELEDAKNKSYNYLARRGFSFQTAKTAFEKLSRSKEED